MTILDPTNREMRLGAIAPVRKISAGDEGPSDSIRRVALAGWLIIAIFFGGMGSWAVTAPLNGAVVGNAVVKVDGNRKSVQHLDGGIVKELRVKEGDKVDAGEILVVLDETQAQAEYDVLSQQYMVLRATEVRLLTELDHGSELVMPQDFKARSEDSYFKSVWNGQVSQFQSRLRGHRRPAQRHPRENKSAGFADRRRRSPGQILYRPDHLGSRRGQGHRAAGGARADRATAHLAA